MKVHNSRNHIPTNRTDLNIDGILSSFFNVLWMIDYYLVDFKVSKLNISHIQPDISKKQGLQVGKVVPFVFKYN